MAKRPFRQNMASCIALWRISEPKTGPFSPESLQRSWGVLGAFSARSNFDQFLHPAGCFDNLPSNIISAGIRPVNNTKPRAVLSLKKASPQPEITPVPPTTQQSTATPRKRKTPAAFPYLQTHWPELFNLKHPAPLQTGILAPIIASLKQREEPYTDTQIGKAIGWYCRRFEYLKALTNSPHRVGIDGNISPISDQDRQNAMKQIKSRLKEAKARTEPKAQL